eukprot:3623855-Prymnesium_polylepis.1
MAWCACKWTSDGSPQPNWASECESVSVRRARARVPRGPRGRERRRELGSGDVLPRNGAAGRAGGVVADARALCAGGWRRRREAVLCFGPCACAFLRTARPNVGAVVCFLQIELLYKPVS